MSKRKSLYIDSSARKHTIISIYAPNMEPFKYDNTNIIEYKGRHRF